MTIKDIGLEYQLVTDSLEVKAIDKYTGQEYTNNHGYFVTVSKGDYSSIFVFDGEIPYLEKEVLKIK